MPYDRALLAKRGFNNFCYWCISSGRWDIYFKKKIDFYGKIINPLRKIKFSYRMGRNSYRNLGSF